MYYFDAAQQTNTEKLPSFFLRSRTKTHVLRVNKSKINGGNTFRREQFEIEGNQESSNDEKNLFWVFLLISDSCFNR